MNVKHTNKGKVHLVGAGPGDAGLITVRGAEVLCLADCVIYDKLVNPDLLTYARDDAELICTPKRIGSGSCKQKQINALLVEKASTGKTVVRLKGGDPCIFGRGSEEAAVLAEAGIDFEIVPGITAAIAGAEYAGILLTDRRFSSQVVFVTGHEAEGKENSNIDWPWLAKFNGSIVLYMAVGNLDFITAQFLNNGLSPDTPAVAIKDATLPAQKVIKTTLDKLVEARDTGQIQPPSIIIIGSGATSDPKLDWFTQKPFFGKNIVVTRNEAGNADFAAGIIKRGGNPIRFPTITIQPLTDKSEFLKTLAQINIFDWIIFTSANGIGIFFECLDKLGKDARIFSSAKIACIGDGSAKKLAEFGIKADFVPDRFTGRELAQQLTAHTNLKDKKILLLRSRQASVQLPEILQKADAQVEDTALYTIKPVCRDSTALTEQIKTSQIHWLTFASPSSADSFFDQVSVDLVNSSHVMIASIGPVTSEKLKQLSVNVDLQAEVYTIDGLLDAIEAQE